MAITEDKFDWNLIDFKGKTSGQQRYKCPACEETNPSKDKNAKDLAVNLTIGKGLCHRCLRTTHRDEIKIQKKYDLPSQEWRNYTNLSDKFVKWIKKERGISQRTLIDCKITQEKNSICFNYFEGHVLINKKYRTHDKKFIQEKNAKKIFYGLNDIIGEKEVYIVEGEFDKLALYEVGFRNCISMPNGAGDLNDVFENCEEYLKDIEKFYIAVDNDEPGKKLEKELTKRLGKWRCSKIEFKGKDANEDLIESPLTLEESLKNPKEYLVDDTYTAKDIEEDIHKFYDNGWSETIKPKLKRFDLFNSIFSIVPGQLTVVTGIPSHGKSNFIEDYVMSLVAYNDMRVSFYSPEHQPMEAHHSVLMEKVIGKPFEKEYNWQGDRVEKIKKSEVDAYINWSKDKVYLTSRDNGEPANWDWLLDKFKEQLFRYGIDIFVIDAWNKVSRKNPDSLGEINNSITKIVSFAQSHGVSVILIAHPTKMGEDEKGNPKIPNLYSVSGSADFRNQTHNGLVVHRNKGSLAEGIEPHVIIQNLKTKFKHQGSIGETVKYQYDVANGRYYPMNEQPDRSSMIELNAKQKEIIIEESIENGSDLNNTEIINSCPF